MMTAILGNTGYFVGIGVEAFVILICGVMLALMLTGVLFKWMAQGKVTSVAKAAAKAAAAEARAVVEEEAAAQAAAEEEAERAQAEIDAKAKKEAEAAAAEAAAALAEKKAKEDAARAEEEAKNKPKLAPMAKPAKTEEVSSEETTVTSESEKVVVKERVIERTVVQESAPAAAAAQPAAQPAAVAEAAVAEADEDPESEFVVVHDGIVFNDSKSITELYEELSPEQQSYFDELREEALTKPDAELAISKNFVSVKIGKRNLIKLLIKRGVTVAEFMLENDALKALRLSNTNKRGKSSIKVKPTVVQVLDLNSLKVAVDMINLSYEELMLGD
ncbi:MAG: hypothetical protein K2K04_01920 [Clostridia bacterium]|nr:hypothetical protein [Clostridia bacterium]